MSKRLVFLVGCPRSGTTWLQLLLAQHPAIATLPETHIFPEYVSPILRRYRDRDPERDVGIGRVVEPCEFRASCREFVLSVFHKALVEKPAAEIILEKTPSHVRHAADILELFPDAQFINIVRDPRAVVASLLDAGRTWGRRWAPQTAREAAEVWTKAVEDGAGLPTLTSKCIQVSYERLQTDTVTELLRLLGFLDLPCDQGFCLMAAEACSKRGLQQEPSNIWAPSSMAEAVKTTLRSAEPEGWRKELSAVDLLDVEDVAGPYMARLGYVPATNPAHVNLRWRLRRAMDRAINSARGLRRMMGRLYRSAWE